MCGLTAIFSYASAAAPVDEAELLKIRDAMLNRGPDGEGLWISEDRRIGLAHRRLAIIDLSDAGSQPMMTPDGSLRVVFNGEIYNFRELRKDLEARGHDFLSTSDTEVLLHLYQEYGRDMVHRLRGMFAFAIWDEQRRGLFVARDPFGIKPLYYADDGGTIRFASQVKALLKGGHVDVSPDAAGHVGFYLWGHVPEPYTLYQGIRALPAGSMMWVDTAGRKEARQYFNVTDELVHATAAAFTWSREEIHERLRAALLDSVRHHLISDVPVGVFLSAGLDSTTLVATASELSAKDLHTVTLGFREFQGTENDEVPLAERVAQHYGTNHQTRWVTKEDFQAEYQRILEVMDQPTIDGINSYFVSKAAKEAGLKVALSGVGGDELFGGYPSFRQIPRLVKTISPFTAIPLLGRGFRYISAPVLRHFTSPKYAGLFEYGGTYGGAYLLRRGMFMPWELPSILDEEIVRSGWAELQTLAHLEQTTKGLGNAHLRVTALETAWYLRNQLLRDTDWASMAHSLEIRTPLVDVELFRAVAPLLNSSCVPNKRDMVQTAAVPVPSEVLRRAKTGFSIPVHEWLLQLKGDATSQRNLRGWSLRVNKPIKRRRILVLLSDGFGGRGGIAKFNRDLLTALAEQTDMSEIVAIPRLMPCPPGDIPAKVSYLTSGLNGKINYLKAVCATLLANRKFDLVISGHINLIPISYLAKKIVGAPLLLIVHGIDAWQPSKSKLVNALVRKIDAYISVSKITKQRFTAWTGLSKENGWILPNSIDFALFAPREKKPELLRRYGLAGKTILMTCGRLESSERSKGFDEVIEVIPRLEQEIPSIAYLIVGDGNDRARLERKARELNVQNRIVFAGHIPESEKCDHYCLADAYVMPSRGEGFGIVYLEAMACGIPTVASKVDGGREALLDGKLGILVDPSDRVDLRRGIITALSRTAKRAPAGLEFFTIDNYRKRLQTIIEESWKV
jgi:asparagine synthase (glutamine-hydrolysing)